MSFPQTTYKLHYSPNSFCITDIKPKIKCFSFLLLPSTLPNLKRTVRTKIKKVMVYVCMAQDTEWVCQKGEEVVDTLQAAKPPCSASYLPLK